MKELKFTQATNTFSMVCRVEINIQSDAGALWELLTDATGFPRWNSTVTCIEGQIREGERLRLHVPGTNHTFTPRVSGVVARERMTWSDGFAVGFKGARTFVLKPCADGSTDFVMEERFCGLIFALVKGMLPDFRPIFEAYASDLKRAAEQRTDR